MVIFSSTTNNNIDKEKIYLSNTLEFRKNGELSIDYYCEIIGWEIACTFKNKKDRDEWFNYLSSSTN